MLNDRREGVSVKPSEPDFSLCVPAAGLDTGITAPPLRPSPSSPSRSPLGLRHGPSPRTAAGSRLPRRPSGRRPFAKTQMFPPDSRGVKRSGLSRQSRGGAPRSVTPRVKHLPQIPLSPRRKHEQTAVRGALESTRQAKRVGKKRPALARRPGDSLIKSNFGVQILRRGGGHGEWLNFLLGLSHSHLISCSYLVIFGWLFVSVPAYNPRNQPQT